MIVQKSVDFNIDLNAEDKEKKTGKDWAYEKEYFEIVAMLTQNSGKTAFHWACIKGQYDVSCYEISST